MAKKKSKPPKSGAPLWMVTYSDLITLVLVFFILLFSMSQVDLQKFEALSQSLKNRQILDFYPSAIPLDSSSNQVDDPIDVNETDQNSEEDEKEMMKEDDSEGDRLDQLLMEVNGYIEETGLKGVVVATRTERGIVLVLPEKIIFDTGDATIIKDALPFLERISSLLVKIPNVVKVEGHTDNRKIHNVIYPSNWELSTARASSVIRYFIEKQNMDPTRFIATGYSDTRPVAPNDGPENWKKNRRVEIVIMDPAYDDKMDE
ncbi:flagellar motor protein MotS [Bacillus andreraoultii]|uniref:flagellar motor protein MotS n=1 Tax=Bacillus andreraoultii TaxID=1499685 RepID=UPI000AA80FED|nr:flagellar motor protein MotS [Bacillus andreraoultii]